MAKPADTLETIELLSRAALEPELWRAALHQLALATGGIATAMVPVRPGKTDGIIVSPAMEECLADYFRNEWWQYDSRLFRIHSRKLSGGVYNEPELFTDEELARDPYRQQHLRPFGIGSFAAVLVTPTPDLVVSFSVQRSLKDGHFERHQLETMNMLGKYAARALAISIRLAGARRLERTLTSALSHLDCGALIVDRDMRVLVANQTAEGMMDDGLSITQGQLHASSPEGQALLARLMNSIFRPEGAAAETVAMPRPSCRRPLLLQGTPLTSDFVDDVAGAGAAALIIIVDPEQDSKHSPSKELQLLGLTRSESRLAALIGAGFSRAEAAEALCISEATASEAIKRIYAKLDISRQSALVKLVDRLSVLARLAQS